MKWIATSALSCAVAGLAMSAAFAQDAGHDMASMPGMDGMHAQEIPAAIARAVNDPGRAEDAKLDDRRKGAQLVAFSGVKKGDRVLELIPGSGYFTRIFSKVVGDKGAVYVALPAEMEKDYPDADKMQALKKDYPNIDVLVQPAAALKAPQPVDVVFTSQNYHDYPDKFMGPTDLKVLNAAVFAVLKPGGLYIIVDHSAELGSGVRDTDTVHRIDETAVKQQVVAAGFEYVGESDVLRNKSDDRKSNVFNP